MKAVQIKSYGGNEVLEIKDIDKPALKNGQVFVEIHAASLNPIDYKLRSGILKEWMPLTFPATLSGDFAGKVVETGEKVFGSCIVLNGGSGALAQFAACNISNMTPMPKHTDFTQAASLPLVGASSIQALEEHMNLSQSQKILIHGGAGGIGSIAIQLAKLHGAYIATTVRKEHEEFVKGLGADQVIDYETQDFSEIITDFDAVFDCVGGQVTNKSFKVLKKGGILISMLGQPDEALVKKYGVTGIGQFTKTTSEKLKRLANLVDEGKIKPQVDKVFPLEQIRQAFDYLEHGHPRGKVVISINMN